MQHQVVQVLLSGAVQGCGVRPALARMANKYQWCGSVKNTGAGVDLILKSDDLPDENTLSAIIRNSLPRAATIGSLTIQSLSAFEGSGFRIEESVTTGPPAAHVPVDVAICEECLAESRDPANRRFAYPFTSCAYCGPRYSILLSMPFDRDRTTLRDFTLCADCRHEYLDQSSRRFHAQTICCPKCGPKVWATDDSGRSIAEKDEAIQAAVRLLLEGKIVAVRGVGGYQLLTDATSSSAVAELRRRKRRPAKPFAVLCRTLNEAHALAHLNAVEIRQLASLQNAIVLVRQRVPSLIAPEVNPGLGDIGLLLPTTALHDRLAELTGRSLICTSGNVDGEPLASGIDDAQQRLRAVADLFLHHNRDITHPIDDSVIRVISNRPVTIRCARGLAPLPLSLTSHSTTIALGGHQKSAIAVSNSDQAWLSAHVGDLDTISAQEQWCERLRSQCKSFGGHTSGIQSPCTDQVVYDPHPTYFPTRWSDSFSGPRVAVWHHHAHVAAAMLEHQLLEQTVLGVAFDGTGLGPDGTVWGGEFLVCTATRFQRVGYLRPITLPGGEAAIIDLRRTAVSVLAQLEELSPDEIAGFTGLSNVDVPRILKVCCSSHSPRTTSCGRLFDAAACLILQQHHSKFEGQPAMCLEAACDIGEDGRYSFAIGPTGPIGLDWRPVFREIISDLRSGTPPGAVAMRFHRGLAAAIQSVCNRWPTLPVVLGGGVFQNRVLVELLADSWPSGSRQLGLPGHIPPNDGGLAAGQLAVASKLNQERNLSKCALEFPAE